MLLQLKSIPYSSGNLILSPGNLLIVLIKLFHWSLPTYSWEWMSDSEEFAVDNTMQPSTSQSFTYMNLLIWKIFAFFHLTPWYISFNIKLVTFFIKRKRDALEIMWLCWHIALYPTLRISVLDVNLVYVPPIIAWLLLWGYFKTATLIKSALWYGEYVLQTKKKTVTREI